MQTRATIKIQSTIMCVSLKSVSPLFMMLNKSLCAYLEREDQVKPLCSIKEETSNTKGESTIRSVTLLEKKIQRSMTSQTPLIKF